MDPAGLASLAVVRRRRCPRDCWRMLVGGGCGGAEGWSWVVGARGREKSMSGLAGTNAVTPAGAAILLEGRRVTLSPHYPPCTRRNPRIRLGAAASSLSRSLLEVLIGAGASESWSLVEDPDGRNDREASSFFLSAVVGICFFCSFSVFFLDVTVLLPPQHLSLYGSVGCFVYKAGNPFWQKDGVRPAQNP